MRKASVSILKAHLSQYLAAVKAGEEVIVTEHGRPVARLSGIGPSGAREGRVAELVREGRLRPPITVGKAATPEPVPADPRGRSLELLLEERVEGR
jgi:prevent-host-death family protein